MCYFYDWLSSENLFPHLKFSYLNDYIKVPEKILVFLASPLSWCICCNLLLQALLCRFKAVSHLHTAQVTQGKHVHVPSDLRRKKKSDSVASFHSLQYSEALSNHGYNSHMFYNTTRFNVHPFKRARKVALFGAEWAQIHWNQAGNSYLTNSNNNKI